MLRLDSRIGSGELEKLFVPYGLKVQTTRLEFGDLDFIGKGPKGSCAVVIERKRITDLVQSMETRRLSGHQLPGMADNYDYGYLIVEGLWKPGPNGELQTRNGHWVSHGVMYRAIDNYISSLALRCGVIPWRTGDKYETVAHVVGLYRMWQTPWADHTAHQAVYAPATGGRRLSLFARKPTVMEKIAMQLPGVDARGREVAKTLRVTVDEEAFLELEGMGPTRLKNVLEALRAKA